MGAGLRCPAPLVRDDGGTRVLWTGHLTIGHEKARHKWLNPDQESHVEVKASMPPFNNASKMEIPEIVEQINAPAFGINITSAVTKIFEIPGMAEVAAELGVQLPTNVLSRFVQDKMPKVTDMIEYARNDSEIKGQSDAIDRLERFVNDFKELEQDAITSMEDWKTFVQKHTARGFESKLHFDHLLSNFGFNKGTSDKLRKETIVKKDDHGVEKEVDFEHHSFRWLSKAFAAYGPEMAPTDVVNAIFAMTNDPFENLTDVDVARRIDAFREKIRDKKFAGLWIPSHLFMDAACDDCMVWVLLTYLYKHIKTDRKLKVLVQLPHGQEADKELLEWLARKLCEIEAVECEVWLDPNSRNRKEIRHYWQSQMSAATQRD